MRPNSARTVAASVVAAALIVAGCDRPTALLNHGLSAGQRSSTVGPAPTAHATAQIVITIQGNKLDSSAVIATGGSGLQLALGGVVAYDKSTNLVRVPVVLVNNGTAALRAPARIYGWEDSLVVTDPVGQAKGSKATSDVAFTNNDSLIADTAPLYAGASVWKLDTLLAPAGQSQRLAVGAQSSVRWIEISVARPVKRFVANIEADASVASIPSAPVHFVIDSGVAGHVPQDTVAFVGDAIPYAFAAKPGYTNVQVRTEQGAAPSTGAVTADTAAVLVVVSTNRVPTILPGAEDLYAKAQALLTATDVPTAYQAYLDAAHAYVSTVPDQATAARGIGDVNALVFNFLTKSAQMIHIDSALAGWSFRIGPDAHDPGGTPILFPEDTQVVAFNKRPARGAARDAIGAAADTIEATTFIFANGVFNSFDDATKSANVLDTYFIQPAFDHSAQITTRLSYNPTYFTSPGGKLENCFREFNKLAEDGLEGVNALPQYLADCMGDASYFNITNFDLLQSAIETFQALANSPSTDKDAALLGHDIQREMKAGRHVIVIAHSQGSLHANAAVRFVNNNHFGIPDSVSLAALALASPVSANWALPNHFFQHVEISGDPVPDLGGNSFPRLVTQRSQRFAISPVFDVLAPGLAGIYRFIGGIIYLHPLQASYLADEAGAAVHKDITLLYQACAVASIQGGSFTATVGNRAVAQAIFFNTFGDQLFRTLADSQYHVDNPAVVRTSTGIYLSNTQTSAPYTITRLGKTGSGVMQWINPVPPAIVGKWTGTWLANTQDRGGSMTIVISGSIFAMNADLTWTDGGKTFHATAGPTDSNHITGDPQLSESDAIFFAGFPNPGTTSPIFVRFFSMSTHSGSPNSASGISSDGSGEDTWSFTLTRVVP